jgi:hypothetical protein
MPPFPLLDGDASAEYEKKEEHKLNLLFAEFKIAPEAPDKWRELALSLARAHVPGFYSMRPSGRPTWWTDARRVALYRQVCRKLEQGDHTLKGICGEIATNRRLRRTRKKEGVKEQTSAGTLAKVFQEEQRRQHELEKNTRILVVPGQPGRFLGDQDTILLFRTDLRRFAYPFEHKLYAFPKRLEPLPDTTGLIDQIIDRLQAGMSGRAR